MVLAWRPDADGNLVPIDLGKASMLGPDDFSDLESPINLPTLRVPRDTKPVILPRPESSFMLVQTGTRKAIAAGKKVGGGRMDLDIEENVWSVPHAHVVWECVMGSGHFCFRNRGTGLILCHDGIGNLHLADPEARGFTSFPCKVIALMPDEYNGGSRVMILDYWADHRYLKLKKDTKQVVAPKRDEDRVYADGLWTFVLVKDFIPASFYS
jgi:hypothetical protein